LRSHSQVQSAGEQDFWGQESDKETVAILRQGVDRPALTRLAERYLQELVKAAPGSERVTDKMPLNYAHLGLIHTVFPDAKIVHIRRNPLDTCLSV